MKTAKQFLSDNGYGSGTNYTTNVVAELMQLFADQSYNQAIDDVLKNMTFFSKGGVDMSHLLNRESITNLRK